MFPKGAKQAPRHPGDGTADVDGMVISVIGEDHIGVQCTTNGQKVSFVVSRFNAARIMVTFALFLGFPMTKAMGKVSLQ